MIKPVKNSYNILDNIIICSNLLFIMQQKNNILIDKMILLKINMNTFIK